MAKVLRTLDFQPFDSPFDITLKDDREESKPLPNEPSLDGVSSEEDLLEEIEP